MGDDFDFDDFGELSLEHEYHNLANDYYKINEFEKSVEHYNKALELNPDLLETYFNRGLAYTRLQQYDKALEDLTKVIELNPHLAEAFYTRGLVYEYKQDYGRAIQDYDKALEVDPGYSKAETQKQVAQGKQATVASGGQPPAMTPGAPGGGGAGGEENQLTEFKVMEKPDISFKDVAGLGTIKDKIYDYIINPIAHPELSKKYGRQAGGGVIMYGPPGCGKTFVAKASAGESDVSFISVTASDIVDMYAGNTEKNLHNAFETARENKPCILFFDEIDGTAGKREGMDQSFEKRAINQFLMELDGAEYDNTGVLAIGATNAPWDIDSALRRPGRFGKAIYLPEPDRDTRKNILKIHLKNRPVTKNLNLSRIARMTEGYSAADIGALVDQAASIPWKEAIKTGKERAINFGDFKTASSGEDGVKPSLPSWYGSVKEKLIEEEDDDDQENDASLMGIFKELTTISGDPAESGGQKGSTTVKHKKENEDLIPEEERQLFSALIKTIEKKADPTYNMLRQMKTMFARYVM